ncbi:MAG: hypothetical protein HYV03_00740 [Deltaproteobacteria bacterium]|nr:hypothetical protein [Deltaproteobacteria bacterium]
MRFLIAFQLIAALCVSGGLAYADKADVSPAQAQYKFDPWRVWDDFWYSADVPGNIVKMETPQMKMVLINFDAKK